MNVVGATVCAASLVGVYLASTLSHSFEHPGRRRFYRMLDQVCIFLLTAGSFTPFGLVHMATPLAARSLLIGMWLVALYGVALADPECGPDNRGSHCSSSWDGCRCSPLPHLRRSRIRHGLLLVLAGASPTPAVSISC